ncbi:hypothetical protein D3C73_1477050 [compost metagenome]
MKPIPAAAHPENEFNSDTTTGISPPPTGAIHTQPKTNARAVIAQNACMLPVEKNMKPQTSIARKMLACRGLTHAPEMVFAHFFAANLP